MSPSLPLFVFDHILCRIFDSRPKKGKNKGKAAEKKGKDKGKGKKGKADSKPARTEAEERADAELELALMPEDIENREETAGYDLAKLIKEHKRTVNATRKKKSGKAEKDREAAAGSAAGSDFAVDTQDPRCSPLYLAC